MLKQHLQFKLSQKLSPQQIQLMKLIQLPIQSFEQQILREIEENPALSSGKEKEDEQNQNIFDIHNYSEKEYNQREEQLCIKEKAIIQDMD